MSLFTDFPTLANDKTEEYVAAYVPVTEETLNLGSEFLVQYNAAKKLFHDTSYDERVPTAQKAQLLNTITSIISALVKGQELLYSIEEVKAIERALVGTLRLFPAVEAEFMAQYEGLLLKEEQKSAS